LVHKRLKLGPEFLPTISILLRPQSIAQASLTCRPTANLNKTALSLSAAQIRSPKNFNLAMASRLAALMAMRR